MEFMYPLLGGLVIGTAVSLMLLFNGRITGVSGIVGGALAKPRGDFLWRVLFILGLLAGGLILKFAYPDAMIIELNRSLFAVATAGLLVGFGTMMGSGCTSGHGICGVSRLSPRSLIATVLFMIAGIVAATVSRHIIGAA